jgi:hypothetical protein
MLSGINLIKHFKNKSLSANETIYTSDNNNYIVICYVLGVTIINNTQSIIGIYNAGNALVSSGLATFQNGISVPFTNFMIGQLQENCSLKFVKGGANMTVDIYIYRMNDDV